MKKPGKEDSAITVEISDKLFFDMVDLLREPKTLIPAEDKCVLQMKKRNDVLDRLLGIRRSVLGADGPRLAPIPVQAATKHTVP